MRPAYHAPIAQPMQRGCDGEAEQERPVSNCSPIALTAPLMTAVSKPNRKPPRAAVAATRTTRAIGTETFGVGCLGRTHGRSSSVEASVTSSVARLGLPWRARREPCQGERAAARRACRGYSERMPVTLLGAAEIRALAAELDVTPTKKLGQNFVVDANIGAPDRAGRAACSPASASSRSGPDSGR